jgi:hypothetical protein
VVVVVRSLASGMQCPVGADVEAEDALQGSVRVRKGLDRSNWKALDCWKGHVRSDCKALDCWKGLLGRSEECNTFDCWKGRDRSECKALDCWMGRNGSDWTALDCWRKVLCRSDRKKALEDCWKGGIAVIDKTVAVFMFVSGVCWLLGRYESSSGRPGCAGVVNGTAAMAVLIVGSTRSSNARLLAVL